MSSDKGFTLIELLIVISIIGILASMALPSYQDRVIRTQVTEALAVAAVAQDAVQEHYRETGRLPANNKEAGLPDADKFVGNFVKSVEVEGGAVQVIMGNRVNRHIAGKSLTLRPAIVNDSKVVPIAWVCGNASIPEGMTVTSENKSTLLSRHMPVPCRY